MLSLETRVKTVPNVSHAEATDGAARYGVFRCVEDSKHNVFSCLGLHYLTQRLDLVKIERVQSGHRTVQSRFHECCPLVSEGVRTSNISLTNSTNSRKDGLKSIQAIEFNNINVMCEQLTI